MKQLLYKLVLVALPVFTGISCTKQDKVVQANGCISRIPLPADEQDLSGPQLDSAIALFTLNGLPTGSKRFLTYTGNVYSDPSLPAQAQVTTAPIINGLPVFDGYESYVFINGKLDTAYINAAKPENTDTSPVQSLQALQGNFLAHVAESKMLSSLGSGPVKTAQQLKDSCEVATLGYIDAAAVPESGFHEGIKLVKVWAITLPSGGLPKVYVEDATGLSWAAIYFAP